MSGVQRMRVFSTLALKSLSGKQKWVLTFNYELQTRDFFFPLLMARYGIKYTRKGKRIDYNRVLIVLLSPFFRLFILHSNFLAQDSSKRN